MLAFNNNRSLEIDSTFQVKEFKDVQPEGRLRKLRGEIKTSYKAIYNNRILPLKTKQHPKRE